MLNERQILLDTPIRELIFSITSNNYVRNIFNSFHLGFSVFYEDDLNTETRPIEHSQGKLFNAIDKLVDLSFKDPRNLLLQIQVLIIDDVEFDMRGIPYADRKKVNVDLTARFMTICFPVEYTIKLLYLMTLASLSRGIIKYSDAPLSIIQTKGTYISSNDETRIMKYISEEYIDLCMKNPILEEKIGDKLFELKLNNYEGLVHRSNKKGY